MSSGGKGGGGGGGGSSPEARQLVALGNRYEKEARPVRQSALGQLSGILNYGADFLGPSMGGPSNYPGGPGPQQAGTGPGGGGAGWEQSGGGAPQTYSAADLIEAYNVTDPGKGIDVARITKGLPDRFTLDELKGGANLGGLSGRSKQAWTSSLGELESLAKGGGAGMGGTSGGGGYSAALLPIAQTAIERSKQATSQAMQGLSSQAASMKGGASDPFFQRSLAQTRVMGDQATSQIPSRIIEQYMQNVLPLAFGQSATAAQSLSSAAQTSAGMQQAAAARSDAASQAQTQQLMQIGSAIAMAAMMT